jgi:putative ABC transport system substrate-binding protein
MFMTRRTFGLLVILVLLVLLVSHGLRAGNTGGMKRTQPVLIGALTESWGPTPEIVGLRDGLLELGYREHEEFAIGVRFTQGDHSVLPSAARELVEYKVDIIFASDILSAQAAQRATNHIPIVFAGVGDPLEVGLIKSFARPGGNLTGITHLDHDLGAKRLEVFRDIVPSLKRVLFVYNPADGSAVAAAKTYREAARRLGLVLIEQKVRTQEEAQATLARVRRRAVDGMLKPPGLSLNIPGFILEAAIQQQIPSMFDAAFWIERGGLASYGPAYYDTGRQAARLVDKILKGAKPAEIPVEVNPKIELAINVRVAKSLGLTIAPEVLYQAHQLIQ